MEKSTNIAEEQVVAERSSSVSLEDVSLAQPLAKIEPVKRTADQLKGVVEVDQSLSQLTVSAPESWPAKIDAVYGSGVAVYQAYLLHNLASSPENINEGLAMLQHLAALETDSAYQELLAEVDSIILAKIAADSKEYIKQNLVTLREGKPTATSSVELGTDLQEVREASEELIKEGLTKKGISFSDVATVNLSTAAYVFGN